MMAHNSNLSIQEAGQDCCQFLDQPKLHGEFPASLDYRMRHCLNY